MANHPNRNQRENRDDVTTEIVNLPAVVDADFTDEAAPRIEEQKVPFLRMAQGLSPELNSSKAQHINGLSLGMIFDTVSHRYYPGQPGLSIVICWKHYHYGCWIPRDKGGGFRGALPPEDRLVEETLKRMTSKYGSSARFRMPRFRDGKWTDEPPLSRETNEEVELVETGHLYILYGEDGERVTDANACPAIVPFTSTALGPYTDYISRHDRAKWIDPKDGQRKALQRYAYRWQLKCVPDKNLKGEFFNWRLDLDVPGDFRASLVKRTSDPLYPIAVTFYEQAARGIAAPDYESARDDGDAGPAVDPNAAPF